MALENNYGPRQYNITIEILRALTIKLKRARLRARAKGL